MPENAYARFGKRALDLLGTAGLLVVLFPLVLAVAAAIKLDSAGPVFYRQERVGRFGRPFRLWKFRSMVVGAETKGAGILVEAGDGRITKVGRFLRKLSLDELPQLFNVLAGEMSLIGPRPGLAYQVEKYDDRQKRRLLLRPGITGWAQIHGRNAIDWERRIELDVQYLERLSLRTDLYVLARTLPVILKGEGMIASADYWRSKGRPEGKNDGAAGGPAARSSGSS